MKAIIAIALYLVGYSLLAADLEEGKVYRLNKTIHNIVSVREPSQTFVAVKDSKFRVIDTTQDDNYVVRFIKIYDSVSEIENSPRSSVQLDEEYKLAKVVSGVELSKSTSVSRGGPTSGPLIIPFKYRIDDETLSGDAAIGYYAGYSLEPSIPGTQFRIPISPFIAGGVSQIAISDDGEIDNQTGITLAVGILIQNWAGVNIGLVYGEDRIGDKQWEHEGEPWMSFMVGWELE